MLGFHELIPCSMIVLLSCLVQYMRVWYSAVVSTSNKLRIARGPRCVLLLAFGWEIDSSCPGFSNPSRHRALLPYLVSPWVTLGYRTRASLVNHGALQFRVCQTGVKARAVAFT
jgi:hypothetical protein